MLLSFRSFKRSATETSTFSMLQRMYVSVENITTGFGTNLEVEVIFFWCRLVSHGFEFECNSKGMQNVTFDVECWGARGAEGVAKGVVIDIFWCLC